MDGWANGNGVQAGILMLTPPKEEGVLLLDRIWKFSLFFLLILIFLLESTSGGSLHFWALRTKKKQAREGIDLGI